MAEPSDNAIWNDGEPANLRAAAMDAMQWLDVLAKQASYIRMPIEDVRRLLACRASLARQLRRPAGMPPSEGGQSNG